MMFDLELLHDPEFRARVKGSTRAHRRVRPPWRRQASRHLAVAVLDEMPDEDEPDAVRAWAPSAAFREAVRSPPSPSTSASSDLARRRPPSAKLSSEVLRHRDVFQFPASITSVVDAPRHVGSGANLTFADWAGTRASTPADRADAWNLNPTISGENDTTRFSGSGFATARRGPDGASDIALRDPHVPRRALRVRLP